MSNIQSAAANSKEADPLAPYRGCVLWRLHPSGFTRQGKSAAEQRDEAHKQPVDADTAASLLAAGGNIGAEITGRTIVVEVEGDPSSFADDFDIDLAATPVVCSDGGFSYLYLCAPKAILTPLQLVGRAGVRIRGVGKVIPVAGSANMRGKRYDFRPGSPRDFDYLAPVPQELWQRLSPPKASTQTDDIETAIALEVSPTLPGRWSLIAANVLARHFKRDGVTTLAFHQGEFLCWEDGRYRTFAREELRKLIYAAIPPDMQGVEPCTHSEREVRAVLESLCFVKLEAPCWIDARPDDPDAREIVAVSNGLLNVPTGELLAHTPRFFTRNRLAFPFDAAAPAPRRFLAILERQFADDPEAMAALAEWFGYCLTPDTRFHHFAVLYGAKRSGKSTVAYVLEQLLGKENVANPTVQQFGREFGLASLLNKLAAIVHDANFAQTVTPAFVEALKVITGAGGIDVNRKHRDHVAGAVLTARPMFVTNNPPNIRDDTGAVEERMLVFPFTYSIPEDQRDADLLDAIRAEEMPGVLLWALEGRRRLLTRGRFDPTESMRSFASDFSADPVREFIAEECSVTDRTASTSSEALYAAFANYCEDQGHEHIDRELFGRKVRDVSPHVQRMQRRSSGKREWHYVGISLKRPGRAPSVRNDWDAII